MLEALQKHCKCIALVTAQVCLGLGSQAYRLQVSLRCSGQVPMHARALGTLGVEQPEPRPCRHRV